MTTRPPILPAEPALETVSLLQAGRYKEVSGNHITMLFGECAKSEGVLQGTKQDYRMITTAATSCW